MTIKAATKKVQLEPRGRGRPKTEDLEALYKHVLAIALEMFIETGYSNTKMVDIALRARVSKQTIYKRFDSKELLFEAVVRAQINSWNEGATAKNPVRITTSLEDALRHLVLINIRASRSPEVSGLNRVLRAEAENFPDLARQVYTLAWRSGIRGLAEEIEKWAVVDGVPCKSPENVAELLRYTVFGAVTAIDLQHMPFDAAAEADLVDRVVKLFLASRASW